MRHIKLAEQFAEQFGKVVVVVDVGQELAVGLGHCFPVDAVHVLVVETLLLLLLNVVKHVLALGCGVEFQCGRECYRGH